jgi:hypothetical protein
LFISRPSARSSDGGCLHKKLLDLISPFANISLKRNLNAMEKECFCYNMSYFASKEKWFYRQRKKVLSAENNVRPNRDDSDHVLIITIDIDIVSKSSAFHMEDCQYIPPRLQTLIESAALKLM